MSPTLKSTGVGHFGPNLGVFPLEQTRHVGVAKSERPRLTNGEIIFEEFQPMWSHHNSPTSQTDRQTASLSCFLPSHRCLTPPSWGTPCDINAIYTLPKSTFSGLQFRRWQYGQRFIRLAVTASETREMWRNAKRIWPYSSSSLQGHPRSSILVSMNSQYVTSYPISH